MRIFLSLTCAALLTGGCKDKNAGNDDISKPVDTVVSAKPSAQPAKIAIEVTTARCIDGTFVIPTDAVPVPSAFASTLGSASSGDTFGDGIGLGTIGGFGGLGLSGTSGMGLRMGPSVPRGMTLKGQTLTVDGLARDDAEKTICAALPVLSPCVDLAAAPDKEVDGTIGIAWSVGADGHGVAKFVGGTLDDPKVQACIVDAASKITFSAPEAKTATITYALHGHRGPKPKSVKMIETGTTIVGRLPPEVIKRIVRANFPRFRACYEQGLKTDATLKGTVVTKILIDTTGDVASASTATGTMGNAAVEACVLGVFKTLAFPEPEGGKVSVTYPIDFENDR